MRYTNVTVSDDVLGGIERRRVRFRRGEGVRCECAVHRRGDVDSRTPTRDQRTPRDQ